MYNIPLGARRPLSNLWFTIIYAAISVTILVLIARILYPPLVTLVIIGVLFLLGFVCISMCLGFYDSAREALDAADLDKT